jgi:hypothetical protein
MHPPRLRKNPENDYIATGSNKQERDEVTEGGQYWLEPFQLLSEKTENKIHNT